MSTSIADVTCADVSSDRRMWSAIPRRIVVTGSSVSPTSAAGSGAGGGAGGRAGGAAGGGWTCWGAVGASTAVAALAGAGAPAGAVAPPSTTANMSFFVTRPPCPVPGIVEGSIPCSLAMRATTGETKALPSPAGAPVVSVGAASGSSVRPPTAVPSDAAAFAASAAAWVAGALWAGALWAGALWAGALWAGSGARCSGTAWAGAVWAGGASGGGGAAAPASPPMRASSVPTSTVSPSGTRISLTTPLPGDGTSVSTLSVEISSSASSAATL